MTDVATAPKVDSASKGKKATKSLPPRVYGPEGSTFVSCDCGCGDPAVSAALYYNGTLHCSKGGPTEAFKATFKVIEREAPAAAKAKPAKRKSEGSASKANTPVKDKEERDDEEEEKENSPVKKKQKAEKGDKKEGKEGKKKEGKKKDDGAPKRAASAFMLYSSEYRPKIKEESPELKMTEIAKKIGEQWNALSEEDKQPYVDQAAQLKAEHQEKYGLSTAEEKKAAKKDKVAKPLSGYFMFAAANRDKVKEEMEGIAPKEIVKVLGMKWKELSDEERKVWNDKSAAAREEFKENGGKAPVEEEKEEESKAEKEKEEESKEEEKEEKMEEEEEVAASQSPAKEDDQEESKEEEKEGGEDVAMADVKEDGDAADESEEPSATQQDE